LPTTYWTALRQIENWAKDQGPRFFHLPAITDHVERYFDWVVVPLPGRFFFGRVGILVFLSVSHFGLYPCLFRGRCPGMAADENRAHKGDVYALPPSFHLTR
jgi:hypothetical protein